MKSARTMVDTIMSEFTPSNPETANPEAAYPEPVAALLSLGEAAPIRDPASWQDYKALGLTVAHVEDLKRRVEDLTVNDRPKDDAVDWVPVHVCRAMGQIGNLDTIPWLLSLEVLFPQDYMLMEEIQHSIAVMGPGAIPAVTARLADVTFDAFERAVGAEILGKIGNTHPEARDECVSILERQLQDRVRNRGALNGMLISTLADLRATEAMPTIRTAYAEDMVDITIPGDLEDIEIDMGVRLVRETPKPNYNDFRGEIGMIGNLRQALPDDDRAPRPDWDTTAFNPYRHVGRNDSCPCGSGKKFKKCCLLRT